MRRLLNINHSIAVALVLALTFFTVTLPAYSQEMGTVTNRQAERLPEDTAVLSSRISAVRMLRHRATDSGITLYRKLLADCKRSGYPDGVARSLTGMGLFHMDKGDYDISLAMYRLAEPYCTKSNYGGGVLLAALYNNIAALYGNRGLFDSAVYYYYKALDQYQKKDLRDTTLLLLMYSNLGGRLATNRQLDQANFYLEKGIAIARMKGNNAMLAKFYNDMATVYGIREKPALSRDYAFRALKIFRTVKDPASEVVANCLVGNSYIAEKQPSRALIYYEQALRDSQRTTPVQQAIVYQGMGSAYKALNDYDKASGYYLKALEISLEEDLVKSTEECYKALASINTALGDYKTALKYQNSYAALRDSNVNEKRMNTVSAMEVKYRTSEKDKALVQQKLLLANKEIEIRRKNNWIIGVGAFSFILMTVMISLYHNRKQKEKLRLVKQEKERELAQLKAMMEGEEQERERIARELHDGIMVQFSSVGMNLSVLMEKSGLAQSEEFERLLNHLENATQELRKSAHNLMPDILLQEGLAEATHYFCKNLQRSSGIRIDFQLIGTLPRIAPYFELMIYRIIQELLQNMVKYSRADYALVQVNCQEDLISVVVEDDGIGMKKIPENEKSTGIAGIKKRLHSLNGHFHIDSEEGKGTSVYIELETRYLQQPELSDTHGNQSIYY